MFARRVLSQAPKVVKYGRRFSTQKDVTTIALASRRRLEKPLALLLATTALATYQYYNSKIKPAYAAEKKDHEVAASLAQPQVVSGGHPQGAFVTIRLSKKADLKAVLKAAAGLSTLVDELSPDSPNASLPPILAGVGFSPNIWKSVQKSQPKDIVEFHARHGAHGDMPQSGGDILLHVKAETQSLCYEVVKAFVDTLPLDSVDKVEDWYGFQFQEGRDLSGFLDGTENPSEPADRVAAAVISAKQDKEHVNGSYAIHQRWVHNLKPFHGLGIDAQEAIVGRSKPDSVEFSGDLSLVTSHVSRMRVDRQKVPIVRQSMPFGTVGGEHGLLFLAYSNTPEKFDILLDRMAGSHKAKDGAHNDAIMTFSKCVASQYYYVPSRKELQSFA